MIIKMDKAFHRLELKKFTVFELRMAEIQIFAGSDRVLFGSLRFFNAFQVLPHRINRAVHVQQFAVQILFRSTVFRLAASVKVNIINSLIHENRKKLIKTSILLPDGAFITIFEFFHIQL